MFSTKNANIFMSVWLLSFYSVSLAFSHYFESLAIRFVGAQAVGSVIPILAVIAYFKGKGADIHLRDIIPIKKPDRKLVLLVILMGILIQPLGMAISGVTSLMGFDNAPVEGIAELAEAGWLAGFLMIAIVPSVFEEIVCRGVFLSGYKHIDPKIAAVINGIVFGVMHMNLRQFFYSFVLGYVIAFIVIRSGNVLYAMLIHFVVNGMQFALMQFTASFAEAEQEAAALVNLQGEAMSTALIIGIALAALFILGIVGTFTWWYYRAYKRFCARCDALGLAPADYDDTAEIPINNIRVHKTSLAVFLLYALGLIVFSYVIALYISVSL